MKKNGKRPTRKMKDMTIYNSNQDVIATVGHVNLLRAELNAKFASVDFRFISIEKKIESIEKKIESEVSRLEGKVERVESAIYRVGALVEEQNAKNNAIFDQMKQMLDVLTRHDAEIREISKRSFIPDL